ncbi:MAG: serine hydrolase [Mesotoga sp.]|nr:serine hydrolase [Mesotoga sp.]NLI06889.1 beta-lactamase family protein [Thermotogaceae bacterium]
MENRFNTAEGNTGELKATPEQPYFIASIGKLFTSVLISMLEERGLIAYDDRIVKYLYDGGS